MTLLDVRVGVAVEVVAVARSETLPQLTTARVLGGSRRSTP